MKDNDGLKILCWSAGGFLALAAIACYVEKTWFPPNHNTMYMAHIEVHADRPLDEMIIESIRDTEDEADRAVREAEERTQDTYFGTLS